MRFLDDVPAMIALAGVTFFAVLFLTIPPVVTYLDLGPHPNPPGPNFGLAIAAGLVVFLVGLGLAAAIRFIRR